jgi:hypothetical protein
MQQPEIKKSITTGGIKALQKHREEHGTWNKGQPWSEGARKKMSESHKKLDHSHLTGGNGTGGSWAEKLMRLILPPQFQQEYIFTDVRKSEGYSTHYKIDFADPTTKIAIEIQGQSHSTVLGKMRDKKKRELLEERGWLVLCITNAQVASVFGISMSKRRKPTTSEEY